MNDIHQAKATFWKAFFRISLRWFLLPFLVAVIAAPQLMRLLGSPPTLNPFWFTVACVPGYLLAAYVLNKSQFKQLRLLMRRSRSSPFDQ